MKNLEIVGKTVYKLVFPAMSCSYHNDNTMKVECLLTLPRMSVGVAKTRVIG